MDISVDLSEKIKTHISENGPMTIADFMRWTLCNFENSYYVSEVPIGKEGDFITAPEISQIFGEIIGIWCANFWQISGSPSKVNIIELGPGKGTLMNDFLRATKNVANFHDSIKLSLVEINQNLIDEQKKSIKHPSVSHYKSYDEIEDGFSIIVANEFFDVLPINQYIKKKGRWHINMVDLNADKSHLCISYFDPLSDNIQEFLNKQYSYIPDEGIIEINDEANILARKITKNIKKHGGASLIIDYGYMESTERSFISTLQSVKSHKFNPIFKNIGNADITSHVNFSNLADTVRMHGGFAHGPITQGDFLLNMCANFRRDMLLKNAKTDIEKDQITSGYDRLVDPKQMGELFKVMAITGKKFSSGVGF